MACLVDTGSILGKGDQLFNFISTFWYIAMESLPQEMFTENCFINVEFLDNKEGEITTRSYWLSIIEIKNGVQQIGTSVLLIVSNYILGLIWRNDSTIYLFDSHFIDENENLSSSGIAALLRFDTLTRWKIM